MLVLHLQGRQYFRNLPTECHVKNLPPLLSFSFSSKTSATNLTCFRVPRNSPKRTCTCRRLPCAWSTTGPSEASPSWPPPWCPTFTSTPWSPNQQGGRPLGPLAVTFDLVVSWCILTICVTDIVTFQPCLMTFASDLLVWSVF